jgi:peptidoglycan hydrolase CwlO-like protein
MILIYYYYERRNNHDEESTLVKSRKDKIMEMEMKMQELLYSLDRINREIEEKVNRMNCLRAQFEEVEEELKKDLNAISTIKEEIEFLRYNH